jgi:hypothetical protein
MNLIAEATRIQNADFVEKTKKIATRLQFSYKWLLGIFFYESRFLHNVINPQSGATGLIQFMPTTAQVLGTNTQALAKMTALNQLDYVEKFYKPIAGKAKNFADVYLYTFASGYTNPAQAPDNAILATGQSAYYHCKTQNVCTIRDFKNYVTNRFLNDFGETQESQILTANNFKMIESKETLFFLVVIFVITIYLLFFNK